MLGVSPILGRGFTAEEGQVGKNYVLLISETLWRQHFGGSSDIIGRRILVDGMPVTIIGVMPNDFHFPARTTQYWHPLAFNTANVGATWAVWDKKIIGRTAPGVTVARAAREVREVWPTLRTLNPVWDPGPEYRRDVAPVPLQQSVVGSASRLLWILFGCVLLVLLVGCVNVANLLLARATARDRELTVRAALGGGRARLVRQLVTESLLLATIGALAALPFCVAALRWLVAVMPAGIPRAEEISVSGTVLAFTAAVALCTGLLFGVVPALRATRARTMSGAGIGRRSSPDTQHHRLSAVLVTSEIAFAVVLVIAATLLVRSFNALRSVDTGFDPDQLIAARITPPAGSYSDPGRVQAFYTDMVSRLSGVSGVRSVALTDKLPMAQVVWGIALRVQGQFEDSKHTLPSVDHFQQVTPSYFSTMRIPLLRGRVFADADRAGQPPVAIVSQSIARRYWPNEDALGKRIGPPWDFPWMTIVGIVPDTKQDSLRDTTRASLYVPWAQRTIYTGSEMWVLLRTAGDPSALATTIRGVARDLDRRVAVSDVRTMESIVASSVQKTRFTVSLVAAFALAALLLGAIGIYGVMSYLVSQRTQEMGIRVALGATAAEVMRLVVGRAARLAVVGALVGIVAALIATRWLGAFLYGISGTDPITFIGVPVLFVGVAIAASYAPALRATRIDPVRALKAD
jgi:predicted permease